MTLAADVRDLWGRYEAGDVDAESAGDEEVATLDALLDALEAGDVRAAEPADDGDRVPDGTGTESGGADDSDGRTGTASGGTGHPDDRTGDGRWVVNGWVKRGILLNFALRSSEARENGGVTYNDVLALADTAGYGARGTRNTPDGTVVRRGAHVGRDCILMSPAFVNVGARVGDGTLVDSCDVVGSCAQVGAGVKLGANTVVGGVLEPVEDAPVVVEDGATLGAGCRVTSGFVVGAGSVVAEGTLLSPRIPVYDLVAGEVVYGRLPPERRAFQRYVDSSVGDHDLFDGGAAKPAVVATDLAAETLSATEREAVLRS